MTVQATPVVPRAAGSPTARSRRVRPAWRPVVLGQTLRLARRSLLGWSLAIAALATLYVSIWPSMENLAGYQQLMENLPEAYRSAIAASGAADMSTASGYLNAEMFSITGPLLVILLAVTAGSGAVAGPEHSHLLDGHLAHPISRIRWMAEQSIAVAVQVVGVVAVLGVVLVLTRPLGDMTSIPAGHLVAACAHLAALGVFFGLLAAGLGAATGRPALTRATCGLIGLIGYLIPVLALMVSRLEPFRPWSPFRWYSGDAPLTTGIHPTGLIVLTAAALAAAGAGTAVFRRRDLRS